MTSKRRNAIPTRTTRTLTTYIVVIAIVVLASFYKVNYSVLLMYVLTTRRVSDT